MTHDAASHAASDVIDRAGKDGLWSLLVQSASLLALPLAHLDGHLPSEPVSTGAVAAVAERSV